jgi:hypothetical protein
MLHDLQRIVGHDALPELLGLPIQTVRAWTEKGHSPAATGTRAVWLTWCLLLHPDRITTAFDLATWGRFRVERLPDPPDDWSV